jgi:carboxyl-terminal processing protease
MMKTKAQVLKSAVIVIMVSTSVFIFQRCSDEKPLSDNQYVNNWIFDNMEFVYYWNTEIPVRPDKRQAPDDFFYSLLSDQDRFSWIQDNYQELLNSLSGINMEAGYEFVLYRDRDNPENVIAQVVYIKANSPAASTDLKRGDVITHINGTQLTLTNYQSMLGQISSNHNITYERYNLETEIWETKPQLALTVVQFAENPNLMSKVFDFGDRKVGYYVYNFFANGPTQNSTIYNQEMDQIFSDFKNSGITDLVLDLRYNSGGSETATIKLASLIAKNVTTNDLFTRWEYNDELTDYIMGQSWGGSSFFLRKFTSEANNIGNQLNGGRLYVLTRNRTASASELIINGLKPYMDVFIIGDTTLGKNVGSISIYEENDRRNKWGMQPIVVKSFNNDNESDYADGFLPNIPNDDNNLVILPLGDENENLLSLALAEITGNPGGRKKSVQVQPWGKMLGSSLDKKRKNFNVDLDKSQAEKIREIIRQHD